MENNLIVTPEQAVRRIMSSVPKYVQRNNSVDNLSDNDNDDFSFMTPELKAKMEADDTECEKILKEELERKVLYGEFGDGLSDLFILTGNIETLQSKVINQLKSSSVNEDMDFEFLEIDSKSISRDYVNNLREPSGNDSGFIVIKDFSSFAAIPDINEQIYMLSKIMRNPFGLKCTGWHIIFLEDTTEKDKWWPTSCIHYFQQKSFLRCWYIE
jgi:hypothetical protein